MNVEEIFLPQTPILEIFLRGTVVYLALFFILRLVLKRQSGVLGIPDLLVVVLIADASGHAMGSDHNSIADSLLMVVTILFWSYALNWLGYRFSWFQRFVRAPDLPLIRDGRMLRKNMRRELITKEELMSQLRHCGCENVEDVKLAVMEGDGRISVISYDVKDENMSPQPEVRI